MFSEHVGRTRERSMSTKKKNKKDLKFDTLEEKTVENGMKTMNIKEKQERKYSPSVEEERHQLGEKDKSNSAGQLFQKIVKKETERSVSVNDKDKKDSAVGLSLFETANVMCSIVDITKDSTMRRRAESGPESVQRHPKKSGSRNSLISQSSHSGPFATLKENAEKRKKSFDEEEDKDNGV